jgi:hypothetical protein
MATTTNFGWSTPDDSANVKDGASAIRSLGTAIDTSLVDLKGGTTGQTLTKATNTDMDFSWATPAAGGGMTVISSGSLPTNSTTLTISSIPTTYKDLLLICSRVQGTTGTGGLKFRVNNITASNTYQSVGLITGQTTVQNSDNAMISPGLGYMITPNSSSTLTVYCYVRDYTNTNSRKHIQCDAFNGGSAATQSGHCSNTGAITSAINRIDFSNDTSNFSGGAYVLYGVN